MIKQLNPFLFIGITLFIAVLACNKNDVNLTPSQTLASKVILSLKDSVSTQDFTTLDSKKTIVYKLDEEHKVLHISTQDSNRFILVETDNAGTIIKGKILQFTTNASGIKSNQSTFNGNINVSFLNGNLVNQSVIVNNQVSRQKNNSGITSNFVTDKLKALEEEYNGPRPPSQEVVVISHLYSNFSFFAFNLLDIAGIGDYCDMYLPIYPDYGGGSDDILTLNINVPEDLKPVNPKKMIDCFGTISSVGATYSISIESTLPVDKDPTASFTLSNGVSGGHAFLTLTKTNANGETISQVMGFYPVNSLNSASTFPVSSQIVNDEGHKFNASYTVSVNSNQFQSAVNQILSLSNNGYSLLTFNCTTFALNVLSSAGINLNVQPSSYLPGISIGYPPIPTALPVYTPNELYLQIQNLKNNGDSKANVENKNAGSSHGPC